MTNTPNPGLNLPQRMALDRMKFPGLLPEEILVFRAWLALHSMDYQRFDYNVRLGSGDDPGGGYPDYLRKQAIANSQLRADAVGWNNLPDAALVLPENNVTELYRLAPLAQATIIEVKRRAATASVSQIASYGHLWATDYPSAPAPLLLLVCAAFSNTILPILPRANIALVTVAVDFTSLARVRG